MNIGSVPAKGLLILALAAGLPAWADGEAVVVPVTPGASTSNNPPKKAGQPPAPPQKPSVSPPVGMPPMQFAPPPMPEFMLRPPATPLTPEEMVRQAGEAAKRAKEESSEPSKDQVGKPPLSGM